MVIEIRRRIGATRLGYIFEFFGGIRKTFHHFNVAMWFWPFRAFRLQQGDSLGQGRLG